MSPVSEASDNSQKFPIVNWVVLFCFVKCLGMKAQRPEERVATTIGLL